MVCSGALTINWDKMELAYEFFGSTCDVRHAMVDNDWTTMPMKLVRDLSFDCGDRCLTCTATHPLDSQIKVRVHLILSRTANSLVPRLGVPTD